MQNLFHHPQKIAAMRDRDRYLSFWCETKSIETGAIERATFGKRHVLDDPEKARRGGDELRQSQSKPGHCHKMGFTRRRDFVQCAAQQPAPKHRINRRDPKRQGSGTVLKAGCPLHG